MESTLQQIASLLSNTLSIDTNVRKSAEKQLNQYALQSEYGLITLELSRLEGAEDVCRAAASIAFKNFVQKNWGSAPEVDVALEHEARIRELLLESLFVTQGVPNSVRNQLCHALHLIAKRDFPKSWPDLLQNLTSLLSSENTETIATVLACYDNLFKKFRIESKSTELWTELKHCLLTTQEPLTALFAKMIPLMPTIDSIPQEAALKWQEIMHLIARIYHSLCFQDFPEYFEDNLKPWVEGYLQLLAFQCPSVTSTGGDATFLDMTKAEICEIFTLFAQRYEDEIKVYMRDIIQSVWQLVVNTESDTRYDGMICSALGFLAIICQKYCYETYFTGEGVLATIAQDVCVKNLALRQEDLELFEDEPIEFMKRDIEGTDSETRRRGAIDLVRALCRRFEGALVPILGQIIGTLRDGNWMNDDIVYSLVTAMASKTETARCGATSTSLLVDVSDYYVNRVREHLQEDVNSNPILKADALKFCVTFRNQLHPDALPEIVQACDRILTANVTVLHKYAAYAIDKILLVKATGTQSYIITAKVVPVVSLLTNLVAGFDKDPKAQNSPYLIKAVLRVITLLDDNSCQHAEAIASKLAALVAQAVQNPADSVHTHFLFETMCVLIKKTSSLPSISLDTQLMPLVENIMSNDLSDYIPYAIQITGVLLDSVINKGGNSDQFITFLNFLVAPELWSHSANIPAALGVLDIYLKHAPQIVLGQHGTQIMTHFARLMASKTLDIHGFQLAASLLPNIQMVKDVANPAQTLLNRMFQRIQQSKTEKFLKLFFVFFARFAIVRGVQDLVNTMNSIQSGMFHMVVEKVIIPEFANVQKITSIGDKRIIAIGFANILVEAIPEIIDIYSHIVRGVTSLVEAAAGSDKSTMTPEEEQAAMYNSEGEFVNPYCRLSYAQKPEPLAPQITNFKFYLADSIMNKARSRSSEVSGNVPAESMNILDKYLKSA